MNYVAILKLDETLWEDIKSGKKYTEVRKLDKDYIQVGFNIVYIGLNSGEVLGEVRCIGKAYQTPRELLKYKKHRPTKMFIFTHYMEEDYLINFTIIYDKEAS